MKRIKKTITAAEMDGDGAADALEMAILRKYIGAE